MEVFRPMLDEYEVGLKKRSPKAQTSRGTPPPPPFAFEAPVPQATRCPSDPPAVRLLPLVALPPAGLPDRLDWTGAEEGTARSDSSSSPLPPTQPTPPGSFPFEGPRVGRRVSILLERLEEGGPHCLGSTKTVARRSVRGWSTRTGRNEW